MELPEHNLFDELIMAPKLVTPFSNELFQNTWNFSSFDQIQELHFPATDLQLISPSSDDHQFIHYPPYPYVDDDDNNNNILPFLDALTSPELFGSFYDDLAIHQEVENGEVMCLENCINGKLSSAQNDTPNLDIANCNVGTFNYGGVLKSKSKNPNGQPSKNLMAERRRRKRLNNRLSMLRSIVPKISKIDRTSTLVDSIDYMKELLDKIQKLREDDENRTDKVNLKDLNWNGINQVRNPPKFEVERRNQDTKVEVCCVPRPGLLMSTLGTLDALGLDIQQCVISCFSDFSLYASCSEVDGHRSLVSSEGVKLALLRNAGYGGRCL